MLSVRGIDDMATATMRRTVARSLTANASTSTIINIIPCTSPPPQSPQSSLQRVVGESPVTDLGIHNSQHSGLSTAPFSPLMPLVTPFLPTSALPPLTSSLPGAAVCPEHNEQRDALYAGDTHDGAQGMKQRAPGPPRSATPIHSLLLTGTAGHYVTRPVIRRNC